MKKLIITALLLIIATPAFALQGTYTWTLPVDANRTGVRVERQDGPSTAAWVPQGAVLGAGVTTFNTGQTVNLGARICLRIVTVSAIADGDPNTPSCVTPDKPMSAGSGTLLITP